MDIQRRRSLSVLRQKLLNLYQRPREELAPFLSDTPMTKGTVYPLRRKCSKASCHCVRGELHETLVLTAGMEGKTRLWTIAPEQIGEIRERTQAYREFRKSRAAFIKECAQRQEELLRLIDAIEQARIRQP